MAFATSDFTLQDLKDSVQNTTRLAISNETVVRAVNYALNIYQKFERKAHPERSKKFTAALPIDVNGIVLQTVVPDLYSDTEGFVVYFGEKIQLFNRIPRVERGGDTLGYTIESDGILRIDPELTLSKTIFIQYYVKTTRFDTSSIDMDLGIPIERDAEQMFEDFILERFFRRKSLPAEAQEAEARFIEKLVDFFRKSPRAVLLINHFRFT